MQPNAFTKIVTHDAYIESLFEPYRHIIGNDYEGYRNHVYRVYNYAMYLLKQDPKLRLSVATALVYHDIGLWTDRELAYLEPSIERCREDHAQNKWKLDLEQLEAMIYWHHKIFRYRGNHQQVVEAVRRADWADASKGMLRKGVPRAFINRVRHQLPETGFFDTLKRLGPELSKSTWQMLSKFAHVFKW